MKQIFAALGALMLGAGAMYYLDPEQGRRRRVLVTDRVTSVSHDTRDYLSGRRKRMSDRVRGFFARVRSRLSAAPPSDEQLLGRVRARLGRTVSYPHAIETEVREGRLIMMGDVLAKEFNTLMAQMWSVPGVQAIDHQLTLHSEAAQVPSMQGRPHYTRGARMRTLARNGACALAIAGGVGAVMGALRNQRSGSAQAGLLSVAIALLGLGVGDPTRRLVRRRLAQGRKRPEAKRRPEKSPPEEERGLERASESAPPAAWH